MKVFISQLMAGRTPEEIISERNEFMTRIKKKYPDATFIDSYDPVGDYSSVYKLGVAIQKLSEADAICFLPKSLTEVRGCLVELQVAKLYGIEIIDTY